MSIKKAYEDTPPTLSPSFVGFADILGFSSRTKKSIESSENEGNKFLNEIRTKLNNAYNRIRASSTIEFHSTEHLLSACSTINPQSTEHQLWSLKVFTDNVVIGLPTLNSEKNRLSEILYIFAEYQLSLAIDGFLIRGGIAHGLHYMDDDIAFGDALIEAATKDKSDSPPRILLAESVKNLIFNGLEMKETNPALKDLLLQDNTDDSIFINYLHLASSPFPGVPPSLTDFENHKKTITKGLNRKPEAEAEEKKIKTKFEWAASYHNFVIDNYLETHPMPTGTDSCSEQVSFLNELPSCRIENSSPSNSFSKL